MKKIFKKLLGSFLITLASSVVMGSFIGGLNCLESGSNVGDGFWPGALAGIFICWFAFFFCWAVYFCILIIKKGSDMMKDDNVQVSDRT